MVISAITIFANKSKENISSWILPGAQISPVVPPSISTAFNAGAINSFSTLSTSNITSAVLPVDLSFFKTGRLPKGRTIKTSMTLVFKQMNQNDPKKFVQPLSFPLFVTYQCILLNPFYVHHPNQSPLNPLHPGQPGSGLHYNAHIKNDDPYLYLKEPFYF